MIVRQFLHTAPIGASYLVGCGGQGRCIAGDPIEDMAPHRTASLDTGRDSSVIDRGVIQRDVEVPWL